MAQTFCIFWSLARTRLGREGTRRGRRRGRGVAERGGRRHGKGGTVARQEELNVTYSFVPLGNRDSSLCSSFQTASPRRLNRVYEDLISFFPPLCLCILSYSWFSLYLSFPCSYFISPRLRCFFCCCCSFLHSSHSCSYTSFFFALPCTNTSSFLFSSFPSLQRHPHLTSFLCMNCSSFQFLIPDSGMF